MTETPPSDGGFFASARRMGESALGLLQTRLALLGVELQEEKLRALNLLLGFAIAITIGATGLFLAIATLALFLWERFGYPGVVALAAICLVTAGLLLWLLRRWILQSPAPFSETAAEFRRDLECLRQE
jgi:uncharacterized membrane protein YqjE